MLETSKQISLEDYRSLAEFRYQIRRYIHFGEQKARAVGLEPQQHQLLLAVKGLPQGRKATISEIAGRLQIQHHSTVELVNRLAERGMVERKRDAEDHRRVIICLTAQGEAILQQLSAAMLTELRTAGPALVEALGLLISGRTSAE
ncbi:MAG: MarR family transcriptional regulator [Ktedonobacteraceae bacterium]|nr:MarR family transcriptional regulator [Ktedonobacteraceae bacterium]